MPRIGLVFPGDPGAPTTASGVPAGLSRGLEELGIEVVPVRAEPPPLLNFTAWNLIAAMRLHRTWSRRPRETIRLSRRVANTGPELAALRSWAVGRKLREAGRLDAIVQLGTGYSLPPGPPIVTFEDMTVAQAVGFGYPHWRALSARAVAARIRRQKAAYEQARACCTRTRWAVESIVNEYGIPPEKVHAVGVGRNHDPKAAPRDWSTPRFLFVGKEWERKNGPAVLRAFARLRAEIGEATLDVVGNHPPLEIEGARGHGLLRETVPKEHARLEQLFQRATCFVMPSHHEPAGIVYIEAAAAGVASIGTSKGGAAELIGDAGRVVDPTDEAALFAAMRELSDPGTAERLGAAAERRAELFTWPRVAERILRALALPGIPVRSLAPFL